MKKHLSLLLAVLLICSCIVAQVTMPAPSSTQTIRQDFGLGRIELTYSRPSIKGIQVFKENSELAPLGQIWRTGANTATRIKFTDKVSMGGTAIDTGSYVLYSIPGKDEWTIILNKGISNWGTDGYKESDDVVRFKVPANTVKGEVETFTMQFANIKPESCELQLLWGSKNVQIPIATNIKDRIKTQLETALGGEKKPYAQAATFYYEWEKDYTKALENVNKAIEANPKGANLYLTKARIQKDMGDKEGAKASAAKCIEAATVAKNNEYIKLANELLRKI